ncbi:hypothetical protein [Paraliomyxa miuraensis]|uniref:hypothetical protein n=1 Tax=Paraliomyxa miuraensis TaxID=376150 RepID=UPI00225AEEAF|nr:hypothetical protein [Paraliomyxa miuraensis]MCX4245582.1 hypothetical protein [Paraliomyxa miuraensis]
MSGLASDAAAAPSTPPPPSAPGGAKRATPPPPTTAPTTAPTPAPATKAPASSSPPSPTSKSGSSPTPPPPTAAAPVDEPTVQEPEPPPQDLSRTWGFSKSQPLVPRYERTDDPSVAAPNPVGFYSGVSVQGNHVPPFPVTQTGTPPAVMTWTGFERSPEGSRVFFQLSAEASYEVATDGLTVRLKMRNTKVNVRNNLRFLDLRYFKTPVRTVKVTRRGRDTVATLVLKRDAVPRVQFVEGKAGYKLLVVQFSDAVATVSDSIDPSGPPPPPQP